MSALIEIMDNTPFYGDLIEDCDEALYDAMIASSYSRLSSLQMESDVILKAKEEGLLVMEDVDVELDGPQTPKNVKGVFNHIKEFLGKIIKFIRDALNTFVEGINRSISSSDEWYKANAHFLDDIPPEVISRMRISIIPYWEYTNNYTNLKSNTISPSLGNLKEVMRQIDTKKELTQDDVYRVFFKEFYALDQNNPRAAAFAYYQGPADRNNESEGGKLVPATKAYNGKQCIAVIGKIKDFMAVRKELVAKTQSAIDSNAKQLEEINRNLEKLGLNAEGYVFGKDLYSEVAEANLYEFTNPQDKYGLPVYKAFLDVDSVSEVANITGGTGASAAATKNNATGTKNPDPDPNTTTTTTTTQKQTQRAAKQAATKANNQGIRYKEANKVFNLCATIGTARMTCVKNIMDHYIANLQQIADVVKKYNGIQKQDTDNREYNENQKKREEQETQDAVDKVKAARRVKRAKMGVFPKLADTLFGK